MGPWQAVIDPILQTPWTDWAGFWRAQVFQGRFINIYFAPLLLAVPLLPRRWIFHGLAIMSLIFIGWALGPAFLAFYLLIIWGLYRLGQGCARQFKQLAYRHPGPLGPAIVIIAGCYYGYMALRHLPLPDGIEAWIRSSLHWLGPHAPLRVGHRHPIAALLPNAHWCGIAYLAMKAVHYMWELRRGTIAQHDRSWWRFLCWTTYGPSLIQGPLERYNDFIDQIEHCRQRWRPSDLLVGLYRISLGIAKRLLIFWYLHPYLSRDFLITYWLHPEQLGYAHLWLGLYATVAELYLDFSGYCDVAIGLARMTGYRMFENFNWPFLAPSLRQFWRRWHMSLSFFLRDYVYIPLGGSRAQVYRNYLLTFIVCGIWHEPPGRVAIWGFFQGLGLSLNRAWQERWQQAAERNGPLYRWLRRLKLVRTPVARTLGWFVTVNFFCLSLLIFFRGAPLAWGVFSQMLTRPVRALLGG